ncbi:16S rRNA (cytidine(1402)-2'-O)-methyltransferase [Chlorobaculum sp. MV4-Y]|uniref:16S rRNA (cytidine(1402)-2'-O)-methyltransferase n=1 Tax=Chlorobaculum sp. MV4-Y TaxID=2976335 RepID=UPI0021AED974|nr:16S rRNA (cytidine(1402)-2'-O)-methyltransferase [Chlorobaculum sp. MV4-Y]UWX58124.1 16S rRNA (cytidine(1402)-2'-O)-methyltransferase [Chlorobaculum sp. MV4-Y]
MTNSRDEHKGTLYVVATPLGNLDDMTFRAVKTLRNAGAIACEDARRTSILLKHFGIEGKRLVSYHSFNEERAVRQVIELLEEGADVALVTDAGTPAISDPGYTMANAAHAEGFTVIPVPGASALTAALSVCPLPSNNFFFAGFLPHKKGRKSRLEFLASIESTIVLYESPHRIGRLMEEVKEHFPEAQVFAAREITKMHEEYVTGTPDKLANHFTGQKQRGEFVVVVHPPDKRSKKRQEHADHQ